jgi:hypothetical protein
MSDRISLQRRASAKMFAAGFCINKSKSGELPIEVMGAIFEFIQEEQDIIVRVVRAHDLRDEGEIRVSLDSSLRFVKEKVVACLTREDFIQQGKLANPERFIMTYNLKRLRAGMGDATEEK